MKNRNTNIRNIKYSEVLSEFIDPILTDKETEETFLAKAKAGMTIWNYCVSKENNLAGTQEMEKLLEESYNGFAGIKQFAAKLVERKQKHFTSYDQFIFKVAINKRPDGSKTLYVESVPAGILKSF
jgi:hypothetical protein